MNEPKSDNDSEVASVGRDLFGVITSMLVGDIYNTPDEIKVVFEAMLADAALLHGWWQNSDGHWYYPILYAPKPVVLTVGDET